MEIDEEKKQRAVECGKEIQAMLEKYSCAIVPYLLPPDPVGYDGAQVLIRASYAVVPKG